MSLLTPQASDALNWLRQRMPNLAHDYFMWDIETALRTIMERYGMDETLIKAFAIEKIVCERDPIPANFEVVNIIARTYKHPSGFYAVTECGLVYRRVAHNLWVSCRYKPEFVRRSAELMGEELIAVEQTNV